jgi:Tfp pilus assembly PilM family ATPase
MARAVGIEIAESAVKVVAVETAGKRPRILSFHESPIPPDPQRPWEERALEALREAAPHARGRVAACLDSGEAILREVSLPFKSDDQIRKTVRFEMESQVHNYTIEDLIVSWYKTGETDKGALLLAAAVPKKAVGRRLKTFQDAGLDPVALDLDVCAIFNAMSHAGAVDTDEPHLLIYGTSKFTKLVLIEQRRPRSIRTIRFSLPADERKAPRRPDADQPPEGGPEAIVVLSEEESRQFHDLDQASQTALVEILAREISRFLLANAASASPAHILLTGDFEDENAARMLESATRIPVATFNLLEAVDHCFPDADRARSARLGVPLGLALKGAGIDLLGMDFRQEEFQYRRKFEAVKTTALVTVELVIVLLAAVALHLWFRAKDLKRDNETVLEHQQVLFETASGETCPDRTMAYVKMTELYRKVAGSPTDLPIRASARQAWRDLYLALQGFHQKHGNQSLGDGPFFLELEQLEISQSATARDALTMRLRGKIRNLEFAGALKNEIRVQELFRNADYEGPIVPDAVSGLLSFTLKATQER